MGRKTQIKLGDVFVSVSEEEFDIILEPWNEYRLKDGGTIRLKTSIQRVFRVLDDAGKPRVSADGDPEVIVRHATQVVATDQ